MGSAVLRRGRICQAGRQQFAESVRKAGCNARRLAQRIERGRAGKNLGAAHDVVVGNPAAATGGSLPIDPKIIEGVIIHRGVDADLHRIAESIFHLAAHADSDALGDVV